MKKTIAAMVVVFLVCAWCSAQSAPCGCTFSASVYASPCPDGFHTGMSCYSATVSCPGTADLKMVYGYASPAGTQNGTIVLLSGSGGTSPVGGG
jgi:hypothetical protein